MSDVPTPPSPLSDQATLFANRLRWLVTPNTTLDLDASPVSPFWIGNFTLHNWEMWKSPPGTYLHCRRDCATPIPLFVFLRLCIAGMQRWPEDHLRTRVWEEVKLCYPGYITDIRDIDAAERLLYALLGGAEPTTARTEVDAQPLFHALVEAWPHRKDPYPAIFTPDHPLWGLFQDQLEGEVP